MLGDMAKPFEVRLSIGPEGQALWTTRDVETARVDRAFQLFDEGMSAVDVMKELGISRAQAFRFRKLWKQSGGSEGMG